MSPVGGWWDVSQAGQPLLDPQPVPGAPTILVDRDWFALAMKAQADVADLRVMLTAVLATVINHSPAHPGQDPTQDFCSYCFEVWPCHSAEVYERAAALLKEGTDG